MIVNIFLIISLINRHCKCLINYDQRNISPLIIIKTIIKEVSYTRKISVREKLYKGSNGIVKE